MSRKISYFFLVCFLVAAQTDVQAQHQQSVVFGLELGAGFSSLSYDTPRTDWDEGGRAAFSGMAFAIVPVFNPVYVQAGLRLHNIGNDIGFETLDGDEVINGNFQITQNYLSVPVRLQVALGNSGPYIMGGVEAGYLLSATIAQRIEPSFDQQEASITDTVNRLNVSVGGGAGYMIALTSGQIYLQGHFSRGITGVADNDGDFSWFSDWVTQELIFTLGLIF